MVNDQGYEEIFAENGAEITEKANPKGNGEEIEEEHQDQPSLITKEFVEKNGLSPNLIGKPYDQLAISYNELRTYDNKQTQRLADLEKRLGEFEQSLNTKEVKAAQEKAEDKLPSMSDFIDDDGFVTDRKGLEDYLQKREGLIKEELLKALEEKNLPLVQNAEQLREEAMKQTLYDNIVSGLEEFHPGEVSNDLVNSAIKEFTDQVEEDDMALYKHKPEKLAKAIIKNHELNLYRNNPKNAAKEKADAMHKRKIEELKQTNKKFTLSNSSPRSAASNAEDEPYDDLMQEALKERTAKG